MNKDDIDKFAFNAIDALIAAGLVLREERSKAAAIVARQWDEQFPEPVPRHEIGDAYGG